jgi:hypothetical protein
VATETPWRRPELSQHDIGEQILPAPWFVDNARTYSILNQIFGPIQRFPQSLKSVRIIAFTFFFDGGVSEAAHGGAQTFDRFVANPEGFRQGMFQGFALRIEGPPPAQKTFDAEGEALEHALRKSFRLRNDAIKSLCSSVRRFRDATIKEECKGDYPHALQALWKALDRAEDLLQN